jgi:hypothetical protein
MMRELWDPRGSAEFGWFSQGDIELYVRGSLRGPYEAWELKRSGGPLLLICFGRSFPKRDQFLRTNRNIIT